jgi:hypothetical protein
MAHCQTTSARRDEDEGAKIDFDLKTSIFLRTQFGAECSEFILLQSA